MNRCAGHSLPTGTPIRRRSRHRKPRRRKGASSSTPGKTATIICGFTIGDDEVERVASRLKRSLGCGGSARGGEILIQGDRRSDVLRELVRMGFKARVV